MKKKILYIEDEPALQKALAAMFLAEGLEAFQALDGESGIRIAKEKKPDIILLDLILPKMNGFAVLQKLKGDPETKDIPVLVLTNLEGVGDIEKVIDMGAVSYLVKTNYPLSELVSRVKRYLNQ
ncbi:MAG: response regulator [Candidatus Sungbacteria bacterium]|nr:response regulator [Candidatus Sungbacteria bacterium]